MKNAMRPSASLSDLIRSITREWLLCSFDVDRDGNLSAKGKKPGTAWARGDLL
jgi:hypothetical protein